MTDEVERLIAHWRRERPDLDTEPMAVLSRVSRLAWYVERSRRAAFAEHDLEPYEFDVLAALRKSGDPYELTAGRLCEETLVTSGTMTNRLDRLERRDLVGRHPDPDDRRVVRVRLRPTGRSAVDGALAGLLAREDRMLTGIPVPDRVRLADLLRATLTGLERCQDG